METGEAETLECLYRRCNCVGNGAVGRQCRARANSTTDGRFPMKLAFWKERDNPTYPLTLSEWIDQVQSLNYGGHTYPLSLQQTLPGSKQEEPDGYTSVVRSM